MDGARTSMVVWLGKGYRWREGMDGGRVPMEGGDGWREGGGNRRTGEGYRWMEGGIDGGGLGWRASERSTKQDRTN